MIFFCSVAVSGGVYIQPKQNIVFILTFFDSFDSFEIVLTNFGNVYTLDGYNLIKQLCLTKETNRVARLFQKFFNHIYGKVWAFSATFR